MGCDIHASIEADYGKKGFDEKANYISAFPMAINFYIDRNYELFGYLARVRNDEIMPLATPKGFPSKDKISEEVEELNKKWNGDAHTHSWLTLKELEKLPDKFKKLPFYIVMDIWAKRWGKKNIRLIFFFDN